MAQAKHLALALFTLFNAVEGRRTQDASQVLSDPLTYGPELELVHLYYDEFPTGRLILSLLGLNSNNAGIAVSSSGRLFSNYPPGLDANNTNNGQNGKYTIAELFDDNTGESQTKHVTNRSNVNICRNND
jgi:hypothetical protein